MIEDRGSPPPKKTTMNQRFFSLPLCLTVATSLRKILKTEEMIFHPCDAGIMRDLNRVLLKECWLKLKRRQLRAITIQAEFSGRH